MKEGEIRAIKLHDVIYYTAYVRKVYFLFRGRWKRLLPTMIADYDEAKALLYKNIYPLNK